MRNLKVNPATYQACVERAVVALAVALVLYLPLEPIVVSPLGGAAYWLVRLAPDGLIALAAAAVLLVPQGRRRGAIALLWVVLAVCLAILVAETLRGHRPADSVNALRVLLRYAVLGALLLAVVRDPSSLLTAFGWAIVIGTIVQVAAGLIEFAGMLWPMLAGSQPLSATSLLGVDGTMGRYDRLGYLMVAALLLIDDRAVPGLVRSVGSSRTGHRRADDVEFPAGDAGAGRRRRLASPAPPGTGFQTRAARLGMAGAVILIACPVALARPRAWRRRTRMRQAEASPHRANRASPCPLCEAAACFRSTRT